MARFTRAMMFLMVFLIVILVGWGIVYFYPYIFSREVKGTIIKVERVDMNAAVLQMDPSVPINARVFSFAIAIKEDSGEIVTASSEDRQWAVVQEGQCAEAVYYPYPPWKLDKADTYYGARLIKLMDCQQKQ